MNDEKLKDVVQEIDTKQLLIYNEVVEEANYNGFPVNYPFVKSTIILADNLRKFGHEKAKICLFNTMLLNDPMIDCSCRMPITLDGEVKFLPIRHRSIGTCVVEPVVEVWLEGHPKLPDNLAILKDMGAVDLENEMLCDKEIVEIRNEIASAFGDEWFDFLKNGKFYKLKNQEKAQECDLKFISKIDAVAASDSWSEDDDESWTTTFSIGNRYFSVIVQVGSWGEDRVIGEIYEVKPVEKTIITYEPL